MAFDVAIGISAGSANTASYLSGQYQRNYEFFTKFMLRKEAMSMSLLWKKHCYLDVDYIYGNLSNHDGESPLDYEALMQNPAEYIVVATDAVTGNVKYFTKEDLHQDDYRIFMGSSAIPIVCRPCRIHGHQYFDGALSDCVPLDKALSMGCDRIVLILSKPVTELRTSKTDQRLVKLLKRHYPKAAVGLSLRAENYNRNVAHALQLQKEGKLLIVAPKDTEGVDTLTNDPMRLDRLYRRGCEDGKAIKAFMEAAAVDRSVKTMSA